jgi:DNA-binding transcriptional MerR regulator
VFGSKCYIKNNDDHLGKFDDRDDEGIFLGYATNSKGYRCFNKRMHKLMDCIDICVDEELPSKETDKSVDTNDENTNEIEEQQFKESKDNE